MSKFADIQIDQAIIKRAARGDARAHEIIYRAFATPVYSICLRFTKVPANAEDLVQETFLRVFRKLGGFEERARFTTWLYRVAANAALDVVRRRQRHATREAVLEGDDGQLLPFPTSEPGPEREAQGGQISDRVAEALGRLTPGERAAFTLRHLQGLSIKEIGAALDMQSNAVKNAIFRAVQKMRRELAPFASEMS